MFSDFVRPNCSVKMSSVGARTPAVDIVEARFGLVELGAIIALGHP